MCRRNGAVQVWHVEVWCYWHPRRSQMIKDSCPAVWLDNQSLYYIYIYQFTDPFTLLEMAHFRKPSPGKIIITTPQVM